METLALIVGKIIEEAVAIFYVHCAIDKLKDRSKEKDQLKVAGQLLYEEWFIVMIGIFKAHGYEDVDIQRFFSDYQADWKQFIKDKSVLEEMLKPFSSPTTDYTISGQLLQERWQTLALQALPEGFDMPSVCRAFTKRLQKVGVVTEELRALYQAQLQQKAKDIFKQIHIAKDKRTPNLLRYEAIWTLAEYYREQPETFPLLRQFATDKQESDGVRGKAIEALVRHFREQPETFPLLRQFATDKRESDWIRYKAIWTLAEYFGEQPETFPLLRQFVTDKQESDVVRDSATGALAKHFREQPETFPLLRQFATDKRDRVRGQAIGALIRYFGKQPEMFPLLRQIAKDKQESAGDHRSAIWALAEY